MKAKNYIVFYQTRYYCSKLGNEVYYTYNTIQKLTPDEIRNIRELEKKIRCSHSRWIEAVIITGFFEIPESE